ncbi:MAG: Conserved hypothetical membrane protein [Parcubacteria group bacterium Gr01-1014_107]|nr:MAG: Conserved hypothetical membrane protein [Parcubacteria group bacterium Gr01-1014_107]
MFIDTVKVVLPAVIAFLIGIGFTPIITNYLYQHQMWKKKGGKIALDGTETTLFNKIHKEKEVGTPRMGGVVIWFSAAVTIVGSWLVSKIFPTELTQKIDFLSRDQCDHRLAGWPLVLSKTGSDRR